MKTFSITDRGKVRQLNEDSCGVFYNKDGDLLAIVADGMGGHLAGDVASTMTTSHLKDFWENSMNISTADTAEKWLEDHILQVNELLHSHSLENLECKGMGTTVVAAICTAKFSTIVHIGDSRVYVLNSNGFNQITEDHTLVNELVRSGQISREDAEHHPRKNVILRALGTEKRVDMDIKTLIWDEEDVLLLCSDGLSNKVTEKQLNEILLSDQSLEEKGQELINIANQNGGEDNITLVIVDFSSESESG